MTTDVSRDERTRDETPLPAQPISAEVLVEKYAKGGERSAAEVRRRVARALAAGEAPESRAHWEARFVEAQERVLLYTRHKLIAGGLHSGMQGDCQSELLG